MNWRVLTGIMLITLGVGLFLYYDYSVRPEREAREMLAEGKIIFERGDESNDKNSINQALTLFTRLISKYPETRQVHEAYYYIGKSYERLNLYRLAYLKYSYLLKSGSKAVPSDLQKDVLVRLAHINVLKQQSEEGIHQLYTLLNQSENREMRGRIYTELGHTYLRTRSFENARRMFDIALQEQGGNEEALLGKARACKHMGNDEEAYNLYEHFLRYYGPISQYTADVRGAYREQAYRSGLNAFRHGRYWNAVNFFYRVLRNFPDDRLAENALYWSGESYFAMRNYDRAIGFFDRVLTNGYYHKDQDAQIKKGYSYFSTKRFDLAAREFQNYLRQFPNGRYSHIASEWKQMSTRELLYRIEAQRIPDVRPGDRERPKNGEGERPRRTDDETESGSINDEEVSGVESFRMMEDGRKVDLENVAEL
jgi:TolA-binding protein